MTVVDAVRDALGEPQPSVSQDRVHTIVARQLQELAKNSSVTTTGYFNHAWAPDLIVSSSDQPDRGVFLRFDVRHAAFADDLEFLSYGSSMFIDLQAANPDVGNGAEPEDGFNLNEALATQDGEPILVTEVPAIDTLDNMVREKRDRREATEQVVIGGKGIVDANAADSIASNWDEAVQAVETGNSGGLRQALDEVEEYLGRVASLDLETGLRARWIAAGHTAEAFPGREEWELSDRAPWELARLALALIDAEAEPTSEQWRAVTSQISASALGHELYRLDKRREGERVTAMVRAGLAGWTAQSAYVPPLDSDSMERFYWMVGSYSLSVNLASRVAYFTDIPNKWNRVPRNYNLPIAEARLDTLASADVTGVGVVTSEEEMSHSLRPTAHEPVADRLRQLLSGDGDPAWSAARIKSMELRVPGTSAVASIDYERSVVRTSDPIPLLSFALLCGQYLAGLNEDELQELDATLNGGENEGEDA